MAKKRKSRGRAGPARHRGIGILFWICLAAIIVAVAIAARPSLQDAFTRLKGGSPQAPSARPVPQVTISPLAPEDQPAPTQAPTAPARDSAKPAAETAPGQNPLPAVREPAARQPASTTTAKSAPAASSEKPATRKARLFFISVDASGTLSMKGVIRTIPASDSPLRDVVETLLKGPTAQELNLGLLSMVPTEAKLRGVTMHGETAFIDFDESFRFNTQGVEAMQAQLRQVIYSATEFPTVKAVQILIDGKKVRYLGTEGARIDEPLSRASFSQQAP